MICMGNWGAGCWSVGRVYLLEHTVAVVEDRSLVELLLDPGDHLFGDEGRHWHAPQPLIAVRRLLRLRRDVVEAQPQRGGRGQLALDLVELVHESGEVHCGRLAGRFIDFESAAAIVCWQLKWNQSKFVWVEWPGTFTFRLPNERETRAIHWRLAVPFCAILPHGYECVWFAWGSAKCFRQTMEWNSVACDECARLKASYDFVLGKFVKGNSLSLLRREDKLNSLLHGNTL